MALPQTPAQLAEHVRGSPRLRYRALMTLAVVVTYLIFLGVANVFSIPQFPGHSISLFQQPSPYLVVIVVAMTFLGCAALATLISGTVRYEAGLFAAAFGLGAVSIRGGPIRYTLMSAAGPGVFIILALELLVLFGIIALGWLVLSLMRNAGLLDAERPPELDQQSVPSQGALALTTHVLAIAFLVGLFAQNDSKGQVLAAVGIAGWIGAMAAHSLFPTRPSMWFIPGPIIVGVIGYVVAYLGNGLWGLGEIHGYAPALARPLPLDYASAGTVGTLIGYWTARRWQEREEESTIPPTPPPQSS